MTGKKTIFVQAGVLGLLFLYALLGRWVLSGRCSSIGITGLLAISLLFQAFVLLVESKYVLESSSLAVPMVIGALGTAFPMCFAAVLTEESSYSLELVLSMQLAVFVLVGVIFAAKLHFDRKKGK